MAEASSEDGRGEAMEPRDDWYDHHEKTEPKEGTPIKGWKDGCCTRDLEIQHVGPRRSDKRPNVPRQIGMEEKAGSTDRIGDGVR
ncbi:hypothetical protein E2C01_058412 [Portunus trituberculatus]|uniref:Uncharacterized protein n=1 Tax=Portunus trituberculatus TaxID=210409 RepID=A0A5B7GWD1_PORTR|nr:hypothetical protein [Portunus trituberculatus]